MCLCVLRLSCFQISQCFFMFGLQLSHYGKQTLKNPMHYLNVAAAIVMPTYYREDLLIQSARRNNVLSYVFARTERKKKFTTKRNSSSHNMSTITKHQKQFSPTLFPSPKESCMCASDHCLLVPVGRQITVA